MKNKHFFYNQSFLISFDKLQQFSKISNGRIHLALGQRLEAHIEELCIVVSVESLMELMTTKLDHP